MATYVGEKVGGIIGSIAATITFVIPAIVSMYFVYKLFDKFKDNKRVNKALKLIRASTFATILVSCFTVIKNTVLTNSNQLNFKVILLCIILYFCMKKKKLHPLIYMAISGVIGIVFSFNM